MTNQIRFLKVAGIVSFVVACLCVQSVYAQRTSNAAPDQKTADFRTWDRLDSGAISPESVRGANSPAIREKAQQVAEKNAAERNAQAKSERQMADFRTWDRLDSGAISPYSVRGSNSPEIRAKAEEMIRARERAENESARINATSRQVVADAVFGPGAERQAIAGMIMSRWERTLYLPTGDVIELPVTALWEGNARISVNRVFAQGPLVYEVTIRTKGGPTLEQKIVKFAKDNGPYAAIREGLAVATYFAPGGPVVRGVVAGGLELMRPTKLNNTENGEYVHWDIRSNWGGITRVFLVHEP